MDTVKHPTEAQRSFLERHVLGEEATILSTKVVRTQTRGFAVNIRGPFKLAEYKFPGGAETVIDASWAGPPESQAHLHCCWSEVQFAKLLPTTDAVRENIGYDWQLCFFATRAAADAYNQKDPKTDFRLFWFYIKNDYHKAVLTLDCDTTIALV